MKKKNIYIASFILFMVTAAGFAATNPTWEPVTINISPASPSSGDLVTFSARLVNNMARAENIKIVGGVDSTELFSRRYNIPWRGTQDVSFTWTATAGEHTAYFEVDPDNEVHEAIETDNLIELTFNVTSSSGGDEFQPNLMFPSSYFNWTPYYFHAGETITINYMVTNNGEADSGAFNVGLMVGSTIEMRNRHTGILSGENVSGSFSWRVSCGYEPSLVVDCDSEVSESNEGDNEITKTGFSCARKNVSVDRIELSSGDDEVCAGAPYRLYADIVNSPATTMDRLRVTGGVVGGSTFFDDTISHLDAGETFTVNHTQVWSPGTHNVYFHADPDNALIESNEDDNYRTFTFTAVDCSTPPEDDDRTLPRYILFPKINSWIKITNKTALKLKEINAGDYVSVSGMVGVTKGAPTNTVKVEARIINKRTRFSKKVFEHQYSVPNNGKKAFKFKVKMEPVGAYHIALKVHELPSEKDTSDNIDTVLVKVSKSSSK